MEESPSGDFRLCAVRHGPVRLRVRKRGRRRGAYHACGVGLPRGPSQHGFVAADHGGRIRTAAPRIQHHVEKPERGLGRRRRHSQAGSDRSRRCLHVRQRPAGHPARCRRRRPSERPDDETARQADQRQCHDATDRHRRGRQRLRCAAGRQHLVHVLPQKQVHRARHHLAGRHARQRQGLIPADQLLVSARLLYRCRRHTVRQRRHRRQVGRAVRRCNRRRRHRLPRRLAQQPELRQRQERLRPGRAEKRQGRRGLHRQLGRRHGP